MSFKLLCQTERLSVLTLVTCLLIPATANRTEALSDLSELWPAPLSVESSFEGLGIDIKGIAMTMSMKEAQSVHGGDFSNAIWRFRNQNRLSKEKVTRQDVGNLKVKFDQPGAYDDLRTLGSHWHTGNRMIRMTRDVEFYDVDRQPSAQNFVASVIEKYGTPSNGPYRTTGKYRYTVKPHEARRWMFDNAQLSTTCEVYDLPVDLKDATRLKEDNLEAIIADLETPEACDGYMEILHEITPASTVSKYRIQITDVRLLMIDALNERRVQANMEAYFERALQSGNKNTPDL